MLFGYIEQLQTIIIQLFNYLLYVKSNLQLELKPI